MRHSLRLAAVLTIALVLAGKCFGQSEANSDNAKPDDKTARLPLVGNWRAMSASMATANGRRSTVADQGNLLVLVVYEKRLTMRPGRDVQIEASYTVDPKQDPATIDLKSADGDLLGLYKLDGDQLTLALNDAAEGRPKDLNDRSCGLRLTLSRTEDFQIWMMNVNGTDPHPFVTSPEYFAVGSPAWSPDGSKVAFDAGNSLLGDSWHLYVVDALGGDRKDLGAGRQSSWSLDGKRLAFFAGAAGRQGLCIIAADGTGFEQLIPDAQWGRWSPVKDEIAYSRGADLYIYDLATKKSRALIDEGYERISAGLNWSPDGQWLCFKGNTGGHFHMAVIHREGKEKGFRVILSREAMPDILDYDCHLCWLKPDGKRIVASVATQKCHHHQLYLIDPEGKVAPQLIPGQDSTRRLSMPASSSDGKRILFIRRPGQEPWPGFLPSPY